MIDLANALSNGSSLAIPAVLGAGLVAGLNPCCLAMYPAAASCCATCTTRSPSAVALTHSIAFVLGTAVATSALGVAAAFLGLVMGQFGNTFRFAIAAVPLLMGLHLLGWLRLPLPSVSQNTLQPGLVRAFTTGFLLSMAVSPCGTPVLAAVLSYVAVKGSVWFGAALLFVYGIGAGAPVLVLGTVSIGVSQRLAAAGAQWWIDSVSGGVLVAVGLYLLWIA